MDDLISRQAAIMHFVKASENYECGMFDLKEVTHELWQVPPAQPEQKKGKWFVTNTFMPDHYGGYYINQYVCTNCESEFFKTSKFCPNCGADMREEKADEH